jgi:hypothetical protein
MGELQHFGREWRCSDSSSNANQKINFWLPFEYERKTTRKVSSRFFSENNHYLWLSIEVGRITLLKVDAQVYHAIEEEAHHLK